MLSIDVPKSRLDAKKLLNSAGRNLNIDKKDQSFTLKPRPNNKKDPSRLSVRAWVMGKLLIRTAPHQMQPPKLLSEGLALLVVLKSLKLGEGINI